jgi:adenosylcobinamide-GDP ribazoletransferase
VEARGEALMRRAMAFLTPLGGARAAREPSVASVAWFPVVGAVVGLAVGVVWWAAARVWPPGVAAALAVAADLALTGLLHVDGLVDAADGLLPPMDRQRRLEVMADPAAGSFGVATAVVVILLRWAALAARSPSVGLTAGIWCASRTSMAVALRALPYARSEGLATAMRRGGAAAAGTSRLGALGMALAGGLAATAGLASGLAAVAAVGGAAAAVLWFAVRRLGGFTGDVLGAAGVIGETAGLLVAAARW